MGWLALLGPPTSRVLESDMSWEHFVTRVIFVPELPVMVVVARLIGTSTALFQLASTCPARRFLII